jgi:glycine reductase
MTREIEKAAGIPVVQIATIVPIMLTVGTNRIVPGIAIPHPAGAPESGPEGDKAKRRELIMRAFRAMEANISEQTIFEAS